MILNQNIGNEYIESWRNGKVGQGVGIGCPETDKHIRFKPNQLITMNGFDNVGKTAWLFWYLLCLSNRHGYTWIIWTGENAAGEVKIGLIEMLGGKRLTEMSDFDYYKYRDQVNEWFRFVDNKPAYTPEELLRLFKDSNHNFNGGVIDPFTGLNRSMDYAGNYEFLNKLVTFTRTNFTIYLTTHPNTEAARKRFPQSHDMWGYYMPPGKSDTEGGQAFANRTDDFWTAHRHLSHPSLKYFIEVHVRKVKEKRTGGEPTDMDSPLLYHWNNGLGYTINGFDPLRNTTVQGSVLKPSVEIFNNDDVPF